MRHSRLCQMHEGFTLLELVIVLVVFSIVMVITIPHFTDLRDRLAVHGATTLVSRALFDAREAAMRLNTRVAVTVDTAAAKVAVRATGDTLRVVDLRGVFRVSLATSRDSIAYAPNGLGYGAANSRYIISRRSAAETVTVSRLGRVKQ